MSVLPDLIFSDYSKSTSSIYSDKLISSVSPSALLMEFLVKAYEL